MSAPRRFLWTTRPDIRAQLLSFLETLPSGDFDARVRVLRLLRLFGDAEQLPLVRALLLDPREHFSVRSWALGLGLHLGLQLAGAELAALLRESEPSTLPEGALALEAYRCLRLVRREEDLPWVAPVLTRWSAWERTECLLRSRREQEPLPAPVVAWLYSRWFDEDQRTLAHEAGGAERNLQVAAATWTRPESWALLARESRDLPSEGAIPQEALHQLLSDDPEALHAAARELRLPLPSLLLCLGQEGLLRRLEEVLHAQSLSLQVAYGLMPAPEEYPRALDVIAGWPEARASRMRVLCDFGTAFEVRNDLLKQLFRLERATALRWALAAWKWPDNLPLVRTVLREAAGSPESGDRPLFLLALAGEDEAAGCFALEGLLGLGESGPRWTERLEALLYSEHPLVRVRAAAGLSRRGRQEGAELLRHTAREAEEPWLRAEAVRWLGALDAPGHGALLEESLRDESWEKKRWPGADEAAWALFQWGSPEALSALLTAHLRGGTADIEDYLEAHLARAEGRPVRELPLPRARAHVARYIDQPYSGG
ncbi:MAG: HEAT repeat domain-containing protein [Cystobacter sp.]